MTDENRAATVRPAVDAVLFHHTPSGASGADSTPASLTIAIIGSGPSGCYAAQLLIKKWPLASITIFESLPTPYGLVRYGVAADHQGTKNVTRQFDRIFVRDGVRFAGNVTIGTDVDFSVLAANFDIVVLATGLPRDRPLGIPQDDAARVVGAGALLRALNGHPVRSLPRDPEGCCLPLGRQLLVVGMGNVAIDVLRLMSKAPEHLRGSDIDDELLDRLRPVTPLTVDVISRSPAPRSKCDLAMLKELLALPDIEVEVTGLTDLDDGPIADLLRPYAAPTNTVPPGPGRSRTRVRLHFGLVPQEISGRDGRTVLTARRLSADPEEVGFVVETVITAVGFTAGDHHDRCSPSEEWSGSHVYRVGWLNRGAVGAIAENRKDAQRVVEAIGNDVAAGRITTGRPGFVAAQRLLSDVVSFSDWQRIEAYERQSAGPDRCRRKISSVWEMLAIASGSATPCAAPNDRKAGV